MRVLIAAALLAAAFAPAEVIDRVAVTIDRDVITESRIREEIRVTALLNGDVPQFTPETKRAAAERLVEQLLIQREMQFTRFDEPTPEDIAPLLKEVMRRYQTQEAYEQALKEYGLTHQQVLDALARQAAVLNFLDLRFKPEVQVAETELMEYFQRTCQEEYRRRHPGSNPTFEEARAECEQMILAERVDARVEAWLKEAKERTRIRYEEDAFQ